MASKSSSSLLMHWLQNVSLIALSLVLLPFSTFILISSLFLRLFFAPRRYASSSQSPKVILVTGVSMTKGLTILQLLAKHTNSILIGADTSFISPGRVSRYCSRFRHLPVLDPKDASKYIQAMLDIVQTEHVDLWISCSGVSSAVEDAQVKEILEKRTSCKSIQFGINATETLHDKKSFISFVSEECGLTVPETVEVISVEEALEVLLSPHYENGNGNGHHAKTKRAANKKEKKKRHEMVGAPEDAWWLPKASAHRQFILKPEGVDDKYRADMTLLPFKPEDFEGKKGVEEVTREHVMRLPISSSRPWLLQEFIRGKEFCTHSLVVEGVVKSFLACQSAELLMHYEALPPPGESRLTDAMLKFTKRVAEVMQRDSVDAGKGGFTGHLSFDFLVKDEDLNVDDEREVTLYPIECNPRAHTAVVLFKDCPEAATAYLDVIGGEAKTNGGTSGEKRAAEEPFYPPNPASYYWLPHDLVTLFLLPVLSLFFGILTFFIPRSILPPSASCPTVLAGTKIFLLHLLFWHDGAFTIDDPVPAWWLYQIYWPVQFVNSLWAGKRWSRINVSTTKMFAMD